MHIHLASEAEEIQIKAFGAAEWPAADAEHFGRTDVNFEKKKYTFVAKDNEQLAGYVIIETDMGVCYIDSIITARACRGKGVGKMLMCAAEEKARAEQCHKMFLVTGKNWAARGFYRSVGYTVVAELKKHYAGLDFVYMEKRLSLKP